MENDRINGREFVKIYEVRLKCGEIFPKVFPSRDERGKVSHPPCHTVP